MIQNSTFEELSKHVDQITTHAQNCGAGASHADCEKPLGTLFLDRVCTIPELSTFYDWSTDCCVKTDPQRGSCFKVHTSLLPGSVPVKTKIFSNEVCTVRGNKTNLIQPQLNISSPTVVGYTYQYNYIVSECCAKEDKEKCFHVKVRELTQLAHLVEAQHKHSCMILDNFNASTLQSIKLVRADLVNLGMSRLTSPLLTPKLSVLVPDNFSAPVTVPQDCRLLLSQPRSFPSQTKELADFTCDHQEELTTKLKPCCELPLLERSDCLVRLDNDDINSTLSRDMKEFMEDTKMCEHSAKEKNKYLARFIHEYARRHPDLSIELNLGIAEIYGEKLINCCETENPAECYSSLESLSNFAIQLSKVALKHYCVKLEILGGALFQNKLLEHFTKTMPQLTNQKLIEITKDMTNVIAKCCHLPENKQMPCEERGFDFILGELCAFEKTHPINNGVKHCCWESYVKRRDCFIYSSSDDSYDTPEITNTTFYFTEDLCTASQEQLQKIKQG
ncbi:serum albumin-like [Discoglossus pictus]